MFQSQQWADYVYSDICKDLFLTRALIRHSQYFSYIILEIIENWSFDTPQLHRCSSHVYSIVQNISSLPVRSGLGHILVGPCRRWSSMAADDRRRGRPLQEQVVGAGAVPEQLCAAGPQMSYSYMVSFRWSFFIIHFNMYFISHYLI